MVTPWQRAGVVVLALGLAAGARAQLQPQVQFEGQWLPVVRMEHGTGDVLQYRRVEQVERNYAEVMVDGRRRMVFNYDLKLVPAAEFAAGFVEIRNVRADLDPMRGASAEERARPDAVRFRYTADLVADRSLSNCFALLTFVSEGSIGTKLIPVGHLGAGGEHALKLELTSDVGQVGSLHVFTEGQEIRCTDHPRPYDLNAYYARLAGSTSGVSAAALLKGAKDFPHVLSDDGRELATVREKDGQLLLVVVDLVSMKVIAEGRVADANAYFANPTWVSPHEIAYVAVDDSLVHPNQWGPHEGRLLLFDVETKQATPLLDRIEGIVRRSRSNPDEIVVQDYDEYGRTAFLSYNVRTRHSQGYDAPGGAGFIKFDFDGRARVYEEMDDASEHYMVRPTPTSRWHDLDRTVTQQGLRFDVNGSHLLDRVAEVVDLGPDGDTAYIASRLNSDRFELDAYSLSQGKVVRTLARLPENDLTNSDDISLRLLFAKHDSRLLGMIFEDELPHVIWLDAHLAALPGHFNAPLDWTDDGATLIYLSYSDRDAGTYYVFQSARGRLLPLLRRNARLQPAEMGKTTAITFPARDGRRIPAYLTRPPKTPAGPAPLVVLIHGGPAARDEWGFEPWNQFLASRGYLVLQVNYRGSSGYGAAFQKAGLETRLDKVVLDDIADGVHFLVHSGEADPRRVVAMGASFGGWATYMSLIKYPDLYCAGVAIAAVSDWRQTRHDDQFAFNNDLGSSYLKGILQTQRDLGAERFIEPVDRAGELHQPILIMHGQLDVTVDARQSGRMVDLLRKTNPVVISKEFPHATHTEWPFADEVELLNSTAAFLNKYVPTAASASN